jgi:hypothetical protein
MAIIKVFRGDKTNIELQLTGDLTNVEIAFGATASKELTAARLIYIENSKIVKSFNAETNKTNISFVLEKEATWSLEYNKLFAEIVDLTNDKTLLESIIMINKDAITPFNGLPVDADKLRYVLLDTKDFEDNTLLLFTKEAGAIPISLDELSGIVDKESFTEPEIDLFNLEGIKSTNGLRERFEKIENDTNLINYLEIDEEGNLTIKE